MFEQLIRRSVSLPEWRGQAQQHMKLSDGDEPEEDINDDPSPPKGGRPIGEWKMPTHKVCYCCKRDLPLTPENFYKAAKSRTGLMSECKECHKARQQKSRAKGPQTVFHNQRACKVTFPDGSVRHFESLAQAARATGASKKTICTRCMRGQLGRDGSKWEYVA